ncbi:MAG: hypothetical protein ACXW1W_05745 [Methylococcaceae bacterium]
MNEKFMQLPLTILVTGNSDKQALSSEVIKAFKTALIDVASLAIDNPVRILTGMATPVEQTAIDIAGEQHWPLHILIPGLLEKDSSIEHKAERLVALGIDDESQLDMANKIRDELALAFADLVVVVGDETQFKADECLLHLLFTAAISRKPLLWLNLQSVASVLDIAQLDDGLVLLLNGHQPEFELLKHCFVDYSDYKELLQTQLYPVESVIDNRQKLTPQLKKLKDYYNAECKSSDNKRSWWSVKPDDKGDRLWTDNKALNSVSQFERFDVSSITAAKHHRRGIWYLYIFAPLAVLSAIAGAIHLFGHEFNVLWVGLELVLLVFIVAALFVQKNQDWHGCWIAERFMAEQLRYLLMGLPLFVIPKIFTEPVWHVVGEEKVVKTAELRSAELWFLQKILHVGGLPPMENKTQYSFAQITGFIDNVEALVEKQIEYHKNAKQNVGKLHQRLHYLSIFSFVLTMIAVLAHAQFHYEWLLFATIGLPAVAAAFYGIGTKLELRRIANQHELTRRSLVHVTGVFSKLKQQKEQKPEMNQWEYWLHVRHLTLAASHIMSEENVQWQALIEGQEPELPG